MWERHLSRRTRENKMQELRGRTLKNHPGEDSCKNCCAVGTYAANAGSVSCAKEAHIKTEKGKQVVRVARKDTFKINQRRTLEINVQTASMRKIQVLSNVCNARPIP